MASEGKWRRQTSDGSNGQCVDFRMIQSCVSGTIQGFVWCATGTIGSYPSCSALMLARRLLITPSFIIVLVAFHSMPYTVSHIFHKWAPKGAKPILFSQTSAVGWHNSYTNQHRAIFKRGASMGIRRYPCKEGARLPTWRTQTSRTNPGALRSLYYCCSTIYKPETQCHGVYLRVQVFDG